MEKTVGKRIDIARLLLIVLGGAGVFIFVYPVARGSHVNIGTILGSVLSCMILVYGIWKYKIRSIIGEMWKKKAGKILLSAFMTLVLLILALVAVITANMVYAANEKPKDNSTMVVLGCAVRDGGPSLMLRERLEAAEAYLKEHPEVFCVVSGGQGPDESVSEALCMYEYLVDHGIEPFRIYMEDKSTSTRENIIFSHQVMEKNGLPENMIIVTNEFHEYRARRIAQKQGIETGSVSGRTEWWLLPTYYVREITGILYEWITG